MKNHFIVIEALDAGGSQTQTDRLAQRLRQANHRVLQLHFPQEDRATGRFVYDKYLLAGNKPRFSRREQSLIYIQDFYSRVEDIQNHLKQSRGVVISDRFYTSTIAYQSAGLSGKSRRNMISWISSLTESDSLRLPEPSQLIYLDTPVEIVLRHLSKKKKDFHEKRDKLLSFQRSYRQLAKERKWLVVNSVDDRGQQRSIEDIHQEIWQHVKKKLSP